MSIPQQVSNNLLEYCSQINSITVIEAILILSHGIGLQCSNFPKTPYMALSYDTPQNHYGASPVTK